MLQLAQTLRTNLKEKLRVRDFTRLLRLPKTPKTDPGKTNITLPATENHQKSQNRRLDNKRIFSNLTVIIATMCESDMADAYSSR